MKYDVRKTQEHKFITENPDFYKKTLDLQLRLSTEDIAWHNPFSDECCRDFGCCNEDIGDYKLRIPAIVKNKTDAVISHSDYIQLLEAILMDLIAE